jgi:NNP family nitrate/nitrite transporter-like MFS transporter
MLLVLLSGVAICLAGIATLPSIVVAMGLLIVTMGMLGMGNGAVFQLLPQRFPTQVGLLTGLVGAAGGLGGFMLPNILGTLKGSTGSFGTGFAVCSLLMGTGAAALMYLGPIWREKWTSESAIRAGLIKPERELTERAAA